MILFILVLAGCEKSTGNVAQSFPTGVQEATVSAINTPAPALSSSPTATKTSVIPAPSALAATASHALNRIASSAQTLGAKQVQKSVVPSFDHIVLILFENHGYDEVIGKQNLPNINRLANGNVLFTNYHSVTHPSLPNYLALIGGSTFGITTDCGTCFVNSPSLPDLIEASGRTWKTYQEDMPSPCFQGFSTSYDLNHDPFMYFDPIRNNQARCQKSVMPLTQLNTDLTANTLPNYVFIMPNICNSGHNCGLNVADTWLNNILNQLQSSAALGQNSMIFIVFDESSADNSSCCGLPTKAGGRVAAILISPLAKNGIQDTTSLSHYSLLKTILLSWNLPMLGFTANPATVPITVPWK